MYAQARNWGIQPSEFWDMTLGEWMLEARVHWLASDEGQKFLKKRNWMADAELTKEEWMIKHGLAKS